MENKVLIDLNCDMGEGAGNDDVIMQFISSANIACGYHAGNLDIMKRTIESAILNNVAIGAHPGFNDLENFGRTQKHLSDEGLYDLVSQQILIISKVAAGFGTAIKHVKPHGALYNMAAVNKKMSSVIAKAIKDFDDKLLLFGLSGSHLIAEAKAIGLQTANEVFADRTYLEDGTLTPRKQEGAMIQNMKDSIKQVLGIILEKKITTLNGQIISIEAETVCIHGDGENALSFVQAINNALKEKGIRIQSIQNS